MKNQQKIEKDLQYMLQSLSNDELETAARTSYEYILNPSELTREEFAKQMAKRYLASKNNDRDKALQKMKDTLKFRKENEVDCLIQAGTNRLADEHIPLRKFLSSKKAYIQGYDKKGRSTYVFIPRRVQDYDPEWTRKGHVWSLERAIACSKAEDKTVNAVVDFQGFSLMRHAPPTNVGKDIMLTLRNHYAGHVNKIFILDAPATFLCFWAMFKPFAGRKTVNKIQFLNTKEQKRKAFGKLYDNDQVPSWMMPSGTKNRELDLEEYLDKIPFNQAFDE